jgi:hypothetical protein
MKNRRAKLVKAFRWSIGFLVGLLALALLVATLVYPLEYVRRVIAWEESDVKDYLYNFPQRRLAAAPMAFHFDKGSDKGRVSGLLEEIIEVDELDTFLAESDTQAYIVIQDDAILYEKYFGGAKRGSMMTSFSVAKSFTSALISLAIADGYIGSVDDPITQ